MSISSMTPRRAASAPLFTLLLFGAACHLSDTLEEPVDCLEGDRQGTRVCRAGHWVTEGVDQGEGADLPGGVVDMPADLATPHDMARDLEGMDLPTLEDQGVDMTSCQPPDAAQACQQSGDKVCEREVMAPDSCGMATSVACGDCGSDMLRCQDNVCVPTSCPATTQAYCQTLVAMNADFCGEVDTMRIEGCPLPAPSFTCDTCTGPRQTCQNNACVCSPLDATADRAQLCSSVNSGMSCGQISVSDGCGGMLSLSDCVTCEVDSTCDGTHTCAPREATALTPPAGLGANARFGHAIAIDGDRMVIGAPGDSNGNAGNMTCGAVYIYERQAGAWSLSARLNPDQVPSYCNSPDNEFGYSVALDGDVLLVGAPGDGINGRGRGFIFRESATGMWELDDVIDDDTSSILQPVNLNAGARLGESVAIKRSTMNPQTVYRLYFGAPHDDSGRRGRVWVRHYAASFPQNATLISSMRGEQPDSNFGKALLPLSEVTLFVGAPALDVSLPGTLFTYQLQNATGGWNQSAPPITLDTLGVPGFTSQPFDTFGARLSAGGDFIAVSAPRHGAGMALSQSGAVFGALTASPNQVFLVSATQVQPNDLFGAGLSARERWLLVGAPGDDGARNTSIETGAVYLYDTIAGAANLVGIWRLPGEPSGAMAGSSVALHADQGIIGAPDQGRGMVYWFDLPVP